MSNLLIRKAVVEDVNVLLSFIQDLAKEEKAEHEVKTSQKQILNTLFGQEATARAVICECDGQPVGHAIYFFNYSTWQGKNGLYVEDLYIRPEYRNFGAGRKIMEYLSNLAIDKNCGRVEWSVLNWNASAIGFYRSLGATPQDAWIKYRLSGNALKKIAATK